MILHFNYQQQCYEMIEYLNHPSIQVCKNSKILSNITNSLLLKQMNILQYKQLYLHLYQLIHNQIDDCHLYQPSFTFFQIFTLWFIITFHYSIDYFHHFLFYFLHFYLYWKNNSINQINHVLLSFLLLGLSLIILHSVLSLLYLNDSIDQPFSFQFHNHLHLDSLFESMK